MVSRFSRAFVFVTRCLSVATPLARLDWPIPLYVVIWVGFRLGPNPRRGVAGADSVPSRSDPLDQADPGATMGTNGQLSISPHFGPIRSATD